MLTAESVYHIAKCLSRDEQRLLFYRIAKELEGIKIPKHPKKKGEIPSDSEMDDLILERIFKVNINKRHQD